MYARLSIAVFHREMVMSWLMNNANNRNYAHDEKCAAAAAAAANADNSIWASSDEM